MLACTLTIEHETATTRAEASATAPAIRAVRHRLPIKLESASCQLADISFMDINRMHNPAVTENGSPLAVGRGRRLMGDHHDDHVSLAGQSCQKIQDLLAGLRIEIARRLVGIQDGRLEEDRPPDRHPLLFPAGEGVGPMLGAIGQPQGAEQLHAEFVALRFGHAVEHRGQGDILQRAHGGEKIILLKDDPDVMTTKHGQLRFVHPVDAPAIDFNLPFVGSVEGGKQVEEGTFAASGWPHDGVKAGFGDFKIDAAQGFDGPTAQPVGFRHSGKSDGSDLVVTWIVSWSGGGFEG